MVDDVEDLGPDPTSQALLRLVPKVGPVLATWREETFERKQQRAEKLAAAAAEDIEVEDLIDRVMASERLTDMLEEAVTSAAATSSDAKIRLLGKALAQGAAADDDAKIDEAEQVFRLAVSLDPIDLRALRALERWSVSSPVRAISFALEVGEGVSGAIVKRLEGLHLIEVERQARVNDTDDDSVEIEETWSATATSERLLILLADPREQSSEGPRAGSLWAGYSRLQATALEALADLGPSSWLWNPRPTAATTQALDQAARAGLTHTQVRSAMRSIGFGEKGLEALDSWNTSRPSRPQPS